MSGIILGLFLSVAACKIKKKGQKKTNETPVYDYVRKNFVGANSKTIHMEQNDAYSSMIPQTTVNSSM